MRAFAALVLAAGLITSTPALAAPARADDPVVYFAEADRTMNTAVAEARRTLPVFWRWLEANSAEADSAAVKIAFPTSGDGREHIWVGHLTRVGGVLKGQVGNEPASVPGLKYGQIVTVDPAMISDWGYEKNGRLYGNFTTRVIVDQMSAEEAEPYRQMLSKTPLEDGQR